MNWKQGQDKDGKKSKYFLQCGDFTITRTGNPDAVKLPYGLHHGNTQHGFFITADAAKAKFNQLMEGN